MLYKLAAFVLQLIVHNRQTGVNPVTFGKSDNAHYYIIGFVMKLLVALLFIAVLMFWLSEKMYNYLVSIDYLQTCFFADSGSCHHSHRFDIDLYCTIPNGQ